MRFALHVHFVLQFVPVHLRQLLSLDKAVTRLEPLDPVHGQC